MSAPRQTRIFLTDAKAGNGSLDSYIVDSYNSELLGVSLAPKGS
jgi:hypothetical protein